jgi:putative membrane protein
MRSLITCGFLMTSLAALAACGGGDRAPAQDPSAARTTTVTSATYESPGSTRAPADAKRIDETFGGGTNAGFGTTPAVEPGQQMPAKSPERLLTDPEIVAITSEAHYAEIAMADIAKRNAVHRDVKNYAAMMLTHHRDGETKEKVVGQKAKIAPAENELSSQLESEMQSTITSLKNRSGGDFDRAYINSQIYAHQKLLDMLDAKLIPSAQNGELKSYLAQQRAQVAMHLAKAQEIKQKLR